MTTTAHKIRTLPVPTDIRTLTPEDKAQPRRVIAYRTKTGRATIHLAIVEPYTTICHKHKGGLTRAIIEATTTGATCEDALLAMSDLMFERNVDPIWLCSDCCGQIRWWLGVTS